MKLRIRGNSLRLRLLQSEVQEMAKSGRVSETIRFGMSPPEALTYTLEISPEAAFLSANFTDNQILVRLPEREARNWIKTNQIGLSGEQIARDEFAGTENILKILIEKDFVCLDRADDPDNQDAFPHPANDEDKC